VSVRRYKAARWFLSGRRSTDLRQEGPANLARVFRVPLRWMRRALVAPWLRPPLDLVRWSHFYDLWPPRPDPRNRGERRAARWGSA
jgi:hypothetical protein